MSQWPGRAPVFPEPGERHRVVRTKSENFVRHRDECVQIERTRLDRSHTCNGTFVATTNSFARLSGQHARPGHAQCARLSGRHRQQGKDILFHTVEVELPWDDTRACGGTPKGGELLGHSNDGEAVLDIAPAIDLSKHRPKRLSVASIQSFSARTGQAPRDAPDGDGAFGSRFTVIRRACHSSVVTSGSDTGEANPCWRCWAVMAAARRANAPALSCSTSAVR
jgi:hypothetical protein